MLLLYQVSPSRGQVLSLSLSAERIGHVDAEGKFLNLRPDKRGERGDYASCAEVSGASAEGANGMVRPCGSHDVKKSTNS